MVPHATSWSPSLTPALESWWGLQSPLARFQDLQNSWPDSRSSRASGPPPGVTTLGLCLRSGGPSLGLPGGLTQGSYSFPQHKWFFWFAICHIQGKPTTARFLFSSALVASARLRRSKDPAYPSYYCSAHQQAYYMLKLITGFRKLV